MTLYGDWCERCGWISVLRTNVDGEMICAWCWKKAGRPFPDDPATPEQLKALEVRLSAKGRA